MPVTKYWDLPLPEFKNQWERIPKLGSVIPFGYTVDGENPEWLNPVQLELDLLEEAKKHVKQYSYRQVADWLSANSGRSISHVGLQKRLEIERKRKRLLNIQYKLRRDLEEAIKKIETLEKDRLGSKVDPEGDGS